MFFILALVWIGSIQCLLAQGIFSLANERFKINLHKRLLLQDHIIGILFSCYNWNIWGLNFWVSSFSGIFLNAIKIVSRLFNMWIITYFWLYFSLVQIQMVFFLAFQLGRNDSKICDNFSISYTEFLKGYPTWWQRKD